MKEDKFKFMIVDNDGKELEAPITIRTTSVYAAKKYLINKYNGKYGEGNFKVKYTSKF